MKCTNFIKTIYIKNVRIVNICTINTSNMLLLIWIYTNEAMNYYSHLVYPSRSLYGKIRNHILKFKIGTPSRDPMFRYLKHIKTRSWG